uniref:RanBP2-type domain-containing protein n=1 Tax=Globodera rostochiensis TaxID=31243 RepID=A0A914I025_GLORO
MVGNELMGYELVGNESIPVPWLRLWAPIVERKQQIVGKNSFGKMSLPLRLFLLKICQQNRQRQHHKLISLITAAGQRESSPPLHFRRFFASNIPPDNEFGMTEGSSSAKQKHVNPKHTEQEQGPLMPTSQVLQMSEKLIQLALTATNLANELIQRNCTSDQMQMQRPPKMDETLVRSHQMQRSPKTDETLVRSHQMQRSPKTDENLVRSHQMQRPPKTDENLVRSHQMQRPPKMDETLVRSHQMQRSPKTDETLVRSHQMQRSPKTDETLVRSHQMQRSPKTDENLVRSHQMQRPQKTDENLRSMKARELKEVGNEVGENAVDATEHHDVASHRSLMGVWQCANCKRDNGKLNDVCFKCGAQKSVGMPKMAKRRNATKKIGGAANETEWATELSYEEVGQHLMKRRIAKVSLDETAGKNWMRDNFFDTELAKSDEAVVTEAQKTVTAVEEEQPISAKNESDDDKSNETVVTEAQKTVTAVEEKQPISAKNESDDDKSNETVVTEAQKTVTAVEEEEEEPISAKNESDDKLGAVFLAGSTEEK